MKIRPPSGGHSDIGRTSVPRNKETAGKFSLNKAPDGGVAEVQTPPPWTGGYRKADLNDPVRKEEIILHAANYLINLSFGSSNPPPESVRQVAADVLAEDPVFRERLMSFLERTLD